MISADVESDDHRERVEAYFDLRFRPHRYIDYVYGDCCEPLIGHGQGVLCDQSAPIRPGDMVAITARTPRERPGLTNGFIKRFVGWGTGGSSGRRFLVTEMLNPRRHRVFPVEQVIAVHRIIAVVGGLANEGIERLEAMDQRSRAAA